MAERICETFDAEAAYDARIAPLMEQIIAICKEERIPVMAAFLYAYDAGDDDRKYCTTRLFYPGRDSHELRLAAQAVTQGFCAFTTTIRKDAPDARS